jgi:hypothetical protein
MKQVNASYPFWDRMAEKPSSQYDAHAIDVDEVTGLHRFSKSRIGLHIHQLGHIDDDMLSK